MNYKSDVKLTEHYRDEQTGFEGVATMITFFQHACERITLEGMVEGKIVDYTFDAPRLKSLKSGRLAKATRPGGPGMPVGQRGPARR